VLADAVTSVLAIVALLGARQLKWYWPTRWSASSARWSSRAGRSGCCATRRDPARRRLHAKCAEKVVQSLLRAGVAHVADVHAGASVRPPSP